MQLIREPSQFGGPGLILGTGSVESTGASAKKIQTMKINAYHSCGRIPGAASGPLVRIFQEEPVSESQPRAAVNCATHERALYGNG